MPPLTDSQNRALYAANRRRRGKNQMTIFGKEKLFPHIKRHSRNSPCTKPGTIYPSRDVSDTIHFDHTSLLNTVIKQFGLTGTLTPRSTAAPTLKDLIPFNHQVYPRPPAPPPPHSEGESVEKAAVPVSEIDAEAALAAVEKQPNPHALAPVLLGLLASKQKNRNEGCD